MKENNKKRFKTLTFALVVLCMVGACSPSVYSASEISKDIVFDIFDVVNWDLRATIGGVALPSNLPDEKDLYSEIVVFYMDENNRQGGSDVAEPSGYYCLMGNNEIRMNSSYSNNYYYLSLGAMALDYMLYYSSDGANWELEDDGGVSVDIACCKSDDIFNDIQYYGHLLVVYGGGITARYTTEYPGAEFPSGYAVIVESFLDKDDVVPDTDESESNGTDSGGFDEEINADNLIDSVKGIISFVGEFPSVISALIGFLPNWLEVLIYVAIGSGVVIFIWKIVT